MITFGYPAGRCQICDAFYIPPMGHPTFDLCVPCNDFYDEWRYHAFNDLDGGLAFEEANQEKVEAMREWMNKEKKQ